MKLGNLQVNPAHIVAIDAKHKSGRVRLVVDTSADNYLVEPGPGEVYYFDHETIEARKLLQWMKKANSHF